MENKNNSRVFGTTFYCVANKRIIKENRHYPQMSGQEQINTFEFRDSNCYNTEEEAFDAATELVSRYSSEFYVLKAVKRVRRTKPLVDVLDLK